MTQDTLDRELDAVADNKKVTAFIAEFENFSELQQLGLITALFSIHLHHYAIDGLEFIKFKDAVDLVAESLDMECK